MTRRSISIRDVAASAGVSVATVSRTLNSPAQVAASTRQAVLEAIRQTGYAANEAARNLRQRRTGAVVALVPNIANQFFSEILAGIAEVMWPAGYNLLIADTEADGQRPHRLPYIDSNRADGVILFDGAVPAEKVSSAAGRRAPPVVMACEWLPGLSLPQVRIDNVEGARLAVAYLAELGHRRIGHVSGPAANVLTRARMEGWCAVLDGCGLPRPEEWLFSGDFTLDAGMIAARRWLALDERPTAVFCSSDTMACGFIGALARAGVAVPDDVSVVGFDDIDLAAHLHPALTTVHQPRRRIGTAAAEALLTLMAGGKLTNTDTVLPVELTVRASAKPPR
ncbi:LacI family DNA-binding transcriptional regulator [Roseitranquillus sediminis]|uniref:LacI family DNA-binding transcriptional regulator n=1 Tax=Roseitranquillus sediminis TaxID=2809051 RepID=UPI001D0C1E6E|nr:LacI family DNA-binding transcriptional regulator [Roseitranquillus sediminis]MBM9593834.1 LacI family DNA-binding transcriptional regulator [Roseitranquillus sediminis]